ncbi:hypothetical protein RQN30_07190 [Arcanobacterium hippocoleae]
MRTVTILGVGYVLGTRAGRERYEQIKTGANKLWDSAPVRKGREKAKETASQTFQRAADAAVANAKGAAAAAAAKVKDAAGMKMNGTADFNPPTAEEIIVEPIEDFRERR